MSAPEEEDNARRRDELVKDLVIINEIVHEAIKNDTQPYGAQALSRLNFNVGVILGENRALRRQVSR